MRLTQIRKRRAGGRAGLEPLAAEPKARGNRAALGAPDNRRHSLRVMLDFGRVGRKSATLGVQHQVLPMEDVMPDISRRGLLGVLAGIGGAAAAPSAIAVSVTADVATAGEALGEPAFSWARVELLKRALVGEIGEDRYESWFAGMTVDRYERGVLYVSVPVVFIKKWVEAYYMDKLVRAAQRVDGKIVEVRVRVRHPRIKALTA